VFRRFGASIRGHPWLFAAALPLLASMVAGGMAVAYIVALIPLTPSVGDIQKAKSEQASVVLTADKKELAVFKRANRAWVKLADISPHVVAALIATEDRRFFEHDGLDLKRTIAAAVRTARGDLQGGSTITQQLARNLYPEEIGRAPTLNRKLKEAITAVKIERVYSKNDILETYLNTVPFLYNAYGIELAARTYFDKHAGQLDVLESATLIGMLKGTAYYNPVLNPERAVQRRNTVMAQMVRYGKLGQDQFDALKTRPLGLDFERQVEDLGPAPHLSQQLRRWLIAWADRNGYNIFADGLMVHTTIDSRMQAMANEALRRQADKLQVQANAAWGKHMGAKVNKELVQAFVRETAEYKAARDSGLTDDQALKKVQADAGFMQALWEDKTRLQAAFMAQDPVTGHVKAWVGSRDFKQDQFDHVQQARRQPGSTFKPFVYGTAFEQGISPAEMLIDQAIEIPLADGTVWTPGDVQEPTGLPMTLRDGLIQSKNVITAQLMQKVGPARVAQVAQAMGVRESKLDQVPSLALGTSPVTLKEMVSSYGTIANNGTYVEPVLVTRITNRAGETLEEFRPRPPEQGLSSQAAQTLLDVMRGVIDSGTGAGIRGRYGIRGDLAGKTGTTQNNTDGWFVLMHPTLVAGAWVGFNDNRITMGDSWGQGARNALHIVGDFFQQSTQAKMIDSKARFAAPRDVSKAQEPFFGRMNEWLNSIFQTVPRTQPDPPAVAVDPAQDPLAPAHAADFQWNPAARQRESAEMGAGPSSEPEPQPEPRAEPQRGVRILREVRP
jgi:penicillin-binding protein 1A